MRVVVALGGNALLRRGEPLTAENQRTNARAACEALAPLALEHELVVSHGNGPQVGLLALQGAAYGEVPTYPLDLLGAQTDGMIGYLIQQELGNVLPFEKHLATLLTQIEVDPATAGTNKPGIFGVGDVVTYPGKLKLILTGFAEAAIAARSAYELVHPETPLHFEYSTTSGVPDA